MWRPGQTVTIAGKQYRVTKSDGDRLKACCLCCMINRPVPCMGRFNYKGEGFWRGECLDKVPKGCYLKPVNMSTKHD